MAQIKGFDPAVSNQRPEDTGGNVVPVGVWGDSDVGGGVFGSSGNLPQGNVIPIDPPAGVEGHGVDGPGVVGRSLNDAGTVGEALQSPGVMGRSTSASGVLGVTFSPDDGAHGVFGSSTTGGNGVTGFVGGATGTIGSSIRGIGVRGTTGTGAAGVLGQSFGGSSGGAAGPAVRGTSDVAVGVSGVSGATDATQALCFGSGYGHFSLHFSAEPGGGVLGVSVLGSGVEGSTFASIRNNPDVAAVRGQSANGWAGLFVGRVRVTGALQKAGGGFIIDHPTDPENRYLSHSFVESPEMLNVYSGTVTTNRDGLATVKLPAYFESLNTDFRYQLTVVGQLATAAVVEEVKDNAFTIATDPGRVKVCWQVTGVRADRWAQANRIPVEESKPRAERGTYLHPELFGRKASASHPAPAVRTPDGLPRDLRRDVASGLSAAGRDATVRDVRKLLTQARKNFDADTARQRTRFDAEWAAVQEAIAAVATAAPSRSRGRGRSKSSTPPRQRRARRR